MKPAARFVDRLLRPRLTILTQGAGTYAIAALCLGIAATMPVMEMVPFSANAAGLALTVFGLSLVARDGLLALFAFVLTAVNPRTGRLLLSRLMWNASGGNFFDVLFVFAADLVYLHGSIYHAKGVGEREEFLTGLAISLNVVLLLGLLYRQRARPVNIGFESLLMLLLYVSGFMVLDFLM